MGSRIRIVTTCQDDDTHGDNVALVERAMTLRPDLLVLPECFSKTGIAGVCDF